MVDDKDIDAPKDDKGEVIEVGTYGENRPGEKEKTIRDKVAEDEGTTGPVGE